MVAKRALHTVFFGGVQYWYSIVERYGGRQLYLLQLEESLAAGEDDDDDDDGRGGGGGEQTSQQPPSSLLRTW